MVSSLPCLQYGNPHSRTHMYGWESESAVEKARQVRWSFFFPLLSTGYRQALDFGLVILLSYCKVGC